MLTEQIVTRMPRSEVVTCPVIFLRTTSQCQNTPLSYGDDKVPDLMAFGFCCLMTSI